MSLKKILCLSVGVRILIVVIGMGLVFFKYIKSENEAVSVVIPPMLNAAASGDYDKIVSLLKNGESTNMIDSAGDSPYSLIGSSPVELNNVGNSALAFAVWNGVYPVNQKCIDLLLQHQADTRLRNKAGQPPHFWVVKIDYKDLRMQTLGKLIKFGAAINEKDNRAFTVLEKIVETYDAIGVNMMLDWWGKLIKPEVLKAAKERAIQYNMGDVLVELNKGIRPIIQDAYWNPSLIDPRTGMNDLHYAVINGDKNLVGACLDRGVTINKASEDEFGMRPLHYAILHYHPDIVEYLISRQVDTNATNAYGNSPLHMIAWLNNHAMAKKIADTLLTHGARLNAQNKDGNTLLHILIYDDNKDLIDLLGKQYEFNVGIQNNDRESAVSLAGRLKRQNLLANIKRK